MKSAASAWERRLGLATGWAVATMLGGLISGVLVLGPLVELERTLLEMGLLAGVILGAFQAWALRSIVRPRDWVLATVIGLVLAPIAELLTTGVTGTLSLAVPYWDFPHYEQVSLLVAGSVVGFCQSPALRRAARSAFWWVPTNAVAAAVLPGVVEAMDGRYPWLAEWPTLWADLARAAVVSSAAGLAVGLLTAPMLVLLVDAHDGGRRVRAALNWSGLVLSVAITAYVMWPSFINIVNPDPCDRLTFWEESQGSVIVSARDACRIEEARKRGETDLCQDIANQWLRESCFAGATSSP